MRPIFKEACKMVKHRKIDDGKIMSTHSSGSLTYRKDQIR